MKNIAIYLLLSVLSTSSFAQSIDEANRWFDRYEFENAYRSFEQIKDKKELSPEDYQRWCYSYFIAGNYTKSLDLSDSLIRLEKTPSYFYYVNGFSAFATKKYAQAKAAFIQYKERDTIYYVDSLIKACDAISSWKDEQNVLFRNVAGNNDKSDFNGACLDSTIVFFHEGGRDGKKKTVSKDSLAYAEIMFTNPLLVSLDENNDYPIKFPPQFKMSNLTSFAMDKNSREVYITINNPLSDSALLQAPHIFTAKIDSLFSIYDVFPWKYSGLEDSSSTAQATLSSNGNVLIFTKQSKKTKNSDLYISIKENDTWSVPKALKKLNTEGDDMFPLLIGDTLLSFSSNARVGYGGLDVYQVAFKNNAPTGNIKHLKAPINSFDDDFSLSYLPGANSAYFSSNRKADAKGDDDIFFIQFTYPDTSSKEKFMKEWEDIIVYFDFDKFSLDSVALQKLDTAKKYFKEWSDLKLSVEGHTDTRGSEEYNLKLGENRAKSVAEYLISNGYDSLDVLPSSKGESSPAVQCEKCSEEQHHLNRFVIIKLVKKNETI